MVTKEAERSGAATRLPAEAAARGWYLYGITRCAGLAAALSDCGAGADASAPLQLLECAELAAVVRPVDPADFTAEVLQERLRTADALEAMVRSHHGVIEAIHARQPILPAKFGAVYTGAADIMDALQSQHDSLLRQLDRLHGCDEWAVHLYADAAAMRQSVAASDPLIVRLRARCAAARPGRAFFLERQLRDELEARVREEQVALAQNVFDRLGAQAVAAQLNPPTPGLDAADETEILRAAFLVARDETPFDEVVLANADALEGVRCEYTGPWPPYSFAALDWEAA